MPEDGYRWEKLFSERMCRHFREEFGLTTHVARYPNVYGPYGTWDGGRQKAPAAICSKLAEAVIILSRSTRSRSGAMVDAEFMYIDDCIWGTQAIMQSEIVEPINLSSSETVTIDQLVTLLEDIAGIRCDRRYDPSAPKGVNGRNSDNTLIREELGWEPSTPLRDGLDRPYALDL